MELGMFTLEELRGMHKSARVNEVKLCETAAGWCERGLNLADSSYIAVKSMMDEMKQLGDQLYAEICAREDTAAPALTAPGPRETASANPYDMACDRFERICRIYPEVIKQAKATIQWANDEWEAAQDNLRTYESQPGIPKPEYRPDATDRLLLAASPAGQSGPYAYIAEDKNLAGE